MKRHGILSILFLGAHGSLLFTTSAIIGLAIYNGLTTGSFTATVSINHYGGWLEITADIAVVVVAAVLYVKRILRRSRRRPE